MIRRAILRPLEAALFPTAPSRSAYGFTIQAWSENPDFDDSFTKVRRALETLRYIDERRFARMQRDVDVIAVVPPRKFAGRYSRGARRLFLSESIVKTWGSSCALIMAHEAIHARLYEAGIIRRRLHKRAEHRCYAETIAFVDRWRARVESQPEFEQWLVRRREELVATMARFE